MTDNLDTLLQIASAANTASCYSDEWLRFQCTFNPSLITKMIEEIKSAREFLEANNYYWGDHQKTREALDAILKGTE